MHRDQNSRSFSVTKNGLKVDLDFKFYGDPSIHDWTRFIDRLFNYLFMHNLMGEDSDEVQEQAAIARNDDPAAAQPLSTAAPRRAGLAVMPRLREGGYRSEHPHPEEARSAVSKDAVRHHPSFETRPADAAQDEDRRPHFR